MPSVAGHGDGDGGAAAVRGPLARDCGAAVSVIVAHLPRDGWATITLTASDGRAPMAG
jgi:hypothetical protein